MFDKGKRGRNISHIFVNVYINKIYNEYKVLESLFHQLITQCSFVFIATFFLY